MAVATARSYQRGMKESDCHQIFIDFIGGYKISRECNGKF